jgi:hypothetical protein
LRYGFINNNGKLLINYKYNEASDFCNGKSIVGRFDEDKSEMEYNLLNLNGELINEFWINEISNLNSEISCIHTHYEDEIWIDKNINSDNVITYRNGNISIIPKFNIYGSGILFNKKYDRALVSDGSKIYLINGKGEVINNISNSFNEINFFDNLNFEFINGLGEINVSETFLIDKDDKIIRKTNSSEILNFEVLTIRGIKININSKYYLIDINGNVVKEMNQGTSNINRDCSDGGG